MQYNFDKIIERKGTNSLKYDYAKEMGKPDDVMPLWLADTDFQIPPAATEAIMKCAQHAIYGYTITKDDYNIAVQNWFARHFGFESKGEWIVKTPGVIFALATAVKAFAKEKESVMIQTPVYGPFYRLIEDNNRKLVENPLIYKNGKFHIDFEDFERKIKENNVKVFILCSPHNPVTRVWTKDELHQMGEICLRLGCLVVSDEIQCDFIYEGHTQHMFPTVHNTFMDNVVLCTAPTKTFNLAGLQNSNIFVPNERLRRLYAHEVSKTGYSSLNTMGLAAAKASYEHGHEWLVELRKYLRGNLDFLKEFIAKKIPHVKVIEPEGTFMVWLDFTAFNMTHDELDKLLLNKAKVWFSSGTLFGAGGAGFQRINIACPRKTLEAGLERLLKL